MRGFHVLSPGVTFYRPRGDTGLHGIGARVGFDRGMGAGQLKAPYRRGSTGLVTVYLVMMACALPCVSPCISPGT